MLRKEKMPTFGRLASFKKKSPMKMGEILLTLKTTNMK